MYTKTTHHIKVSVEPTFLEEQSLPFDNQYVWAYQVFIENQGSRTVQLMQRKWQITDGKGKVSTVVGQGVVGEQPVIPPGRVYQYTSGTPLSTPSGLMQGVYVMRTAAGDIFEVEIPMFSLDSPYEKALVH